MHFSGNIKDRIYSTRSCPAVIEHSWKTFASRPAFSNSSLASAIISKLEFHTLPSVNCKPKRTYQRRDRFYKKTRSVQTLEGLISNYEK